MSIEASIKGWLGEVQCTLAKKLFLDSSVYFDVNNVTRGMRRNGTENRVKQFAYSISAELRKGRNSPLTTASGTENE